MVTRLIKIALLTGAAHLFTVVTLKLLSKHIDSDDISLIGEIDSLFQLIISLLAFGLQLSAVRNIASSDNWKKIYQQVQVARNTMAFLLIPFAVLYFINSPYQYFLLAPVFALSGDYALYGTGKPVAAAAMAFLRVFIPSLVLVVFSFWLKDYIIAAYVASTILVFWLTSVVIAKWLGSPYWYKPALKSLSMYIRSIALGIVTLSYYMVGLGLIVVATNFYNSAVVAVAYLGLKLYMIFKGVLRIVNQAFIKEMLEDDVCLKVDQIASFAGLVFAGALIVFPGGFTSLFFSDKYQGYSSFMMTIGLAGLSSAVFTSLTTRSLLKNKDKLYALYAAVSGAASLLIVIVLSFIYQNPLSIGLALLAGELLTATGLILINKDVSIKERLFFLAPISGLLIIPVGVRILAGDNIISMASGILLFMLTGGVLFFKRFTVAQGGKVTSF